jgi:hypothetical protein
VPVSSPALRYYFSHCSHLTFSAPPVRTGSSLISDWPSRKPALARNRTANIPQTPAPSADLSEVAPPRNRYRSRRVHLRHSAGTCRSVRRARTRIRSPSVRFSPPAKPFGRIHRSALPRYAHRPSSASPRRRGPQLRDHACQGADTWTPGAGARARIPGRAQLRACNYQSSRCSAWGE